MAYLLVKGEFLVKCLSEGCSFSAKIEITDGILGETEEDVLATAGELAKMMAVFKHQKDSPDHIFEKKSDPDHIFEDMSIEKCSGIYEFVSLQKLVRTEQEEAVKYRTYKKDDVILSGNENFYGLCEVVKGAAYINRAKTCIFKPGESFGLSELCVNQVRNGDLIASDDETIIAFYNIKELFRTDLKKCMDLYHASVQNIFALIDHLKDETSELEAKLEKQDIQLKNKEIQFQLLKKQLFQKKV